MSRTNKIILAVIVVLLLLCMCVCVSGILLVGSAGRLIQTSVVTDPTKVEQLAAGIADYNLPAGYSQAGMNFLGIFQGVVLTNETDSRQAIMLIQIPAIAGMDQQQFEQQFQQSLDSQSSGGGLQWQITGTLPATLRGQEVTLNVREATNQNGEKFRNISGIFQGRNGPVILTINSPESLWDQAAVEAFLGSIR